ncbi:MAG: polyhydroxyalkanoate synthesis regulator DNA-binding domain-containing protein [Polyangia bacterium]
MPHDVGTMVRIIKRYANRKLYDTKDSHYVTLGKLAELIRAGEELQVIENGTQREITAATMAQIIFEEEKRSSKLPVEGLGRIIRNGLPVQP